MMANIGKHIRVLRGEKGLTQDALAQKLFISRQTVSHYETGKSNPDIDTLVKIAEALDADVNALIYGPPVQPTRKKEARRLLVQAVIALLFGALMLVYLPRLKEMWMRFEALAGGLHQLLRFYLLPAFYVFLGWTFVQAVEFIYGVRLAKDAFAKARPFVWTLVFLYFIVCLPYICSYVDYSIQVYRLQQTQTEFSASYSFVFIPWLDRFIWNVMMRYVYPYSPAFLLGGMALRVTRKIRAS